MVLWGKTIVFSAAANAFGLEGDPDTQ